jgi:hypothetical protein
MRSWYNRKEALGTIKLTKDDIESAINHLNKLPMLEQAVAFEDGTITELFHHLRLIKAEMQRIEVELKEKEIKENYWDI